MGNISSLHRRMYHIFHCFLADVDDIARLLAALWAFQMKHNSRHTWLDILPLHGTSELSATGAVIPGIFEVYAIQSQNLVFMPVFWWHIGITLIHSASKSPSGVTSFGHPSVYNSNKHSALTVYPSTVSPSNETLL